MGQRFVILRHEVNGAAHFDLMLEIAGQSPLRTLQLARWPLAMGESCAATELPPHRREYLDYEGEVSGGRGQVTRVGRGVWKGQGNNIELDDGTMLNLDKGVILRTA